MRPILDGSFTVSLEGNAFIVDGQCAAVVVHRDSYFIVYDRMGHGDSDFSKGAEVISARTLSGAFGLFASLCADHELNEK